MRHPGGRRIKLRSKTVKEQKHLLRHRPCNQDLDPLSPCFGVRRPMQRVGGCSYARDHLPALR
jgi:hypothetical protein